MFDYDSTGLWHASDDGRDRPAGTVDPNELPLSETTKVRLAAWVQRCDDLNIRKIAVTDEPSPSAAEWDTLHQEAIALWHALRQEAAPSWEVGFRTASGVAWTDADLR